MDFLRHFPLFSIIIAFVGVVLSSLLNRKASRIVAITCEIICIGLGIGTLLYTLENGSTIYQMGHLTEIEGDSTVYYWFNNVIRFGVTEALLAIAFSTILLLSVIGGKKKIEEDVAANKENYYYVLCNLVLVALIALIYTDDVFTGYVFLEISTLSSIGLIMIKQKGRTTIAAIRYMIFNLVGSGLFLIGIVLLYDLTGYFMLEKIMAQLSELASNNQGLPAIACSFALIAIGLGIKSGLFPFYFWMPDAYGESTPTSSSIVSGLISKGYIFLLIKFIYRAYGFNHHFTIDGNDVVLGVIEQTGMLDIIFYLGVCGMIFGSISAIVQKRINKMIAFSSAAQIGYIYLAIGLGEVGMVAAIFQMLTHAITKPLLFIASSGLVDSSDDHQQFRYLKGAGRRNIVAGIGFSIGALSMIGFPFLAGFNVKFLFVQAALSSSVSITKLVFTITALVLSTLLNTAYFIRTAITIYSPTKECGEVVKPKWYYTLSIIAFIALNIFLATAPIILHLLEIGMGAMGYLIV